MNTTASNRRLRVLITDIRDGKLIPDPDFQRRLVWTDKDKKKFLNTVLKGYPFPEIYIAAGDVDSETGEGTELLVDGQQRITTLYQYFIGSKELKLGKDFPPYTELSQEQKKRFLEYEVVVRDLGHISIQEIKKIFETINATSYSLNAMEVHNSRYDGEFKKFAEELTQHPFFNRDKPRIFSNNDVRRMRDMSFVLTLIITVMSTYFSREDEKMLEEYLSRYNNEFEQKEELREQLQYVFEFIERCLFDEECRGWKTSDLFTLLVELHRLLAIDKVTLDPNKVGGTLKKFYEDVDIYAKNGALPLYSKNRWHLDVPDYYKATLQGTNDRSSRIRRGQIIRSIIIPEELNQKK